jgi:hypothetical protein
VKYSKKFRGGDWKEHIDQEMVGSDYYMYMYLYFIPSQKYCETVRKFCIQQDATFKLTCQYKFIVLIAEE